MDNILLESETTPIRFSPRPSPALKLMNVGEFEIENGLTELWFKKESFTIIPENKELPVLNEDLLSIPNS